MKFVVCTVAASLAFCLLGETAMEKYARYTESRRYCVSRVIDGDHVITTWWRDGRPDWILPSVETNRLRSITGARQNNPLQNQIQKLDSDIRELNRQLADEISKYVSASNRAEIAETKLSAVKDGLTTERAKWQSKYDSASTLLKPVYKLGLDLIDSILAKIETTLAN